MTRNLMLASLKPYLKDKNMTPQKLVPLIGDNGIEEEHITEISDSEIESLKKQAERISAIIAKGNMVEFDIKKL